MYSKEQASQIRQSFWNTFGQYMKPVLSSSAARVNWINYKTGFKHLYFRMQADQKEASIAIEITHPDTSIQELFFEQFTELKGLLHSYLNEEWNWEYAIQDTNGKVISRISKTLRPVNIFVHDQWPDLISFFKPRIIKLDEFWIDLKDVFEALR